MHEVAIATALIDLVREQAAAARARRVTRLVVEIGTLSHVDVHALRFAVDAASRGGFAEGAALDILEPPGTAYCLDCESSVTISARGASCPRCDGAKLLVQGGDEMRLKEMEVV
jgi:hydrogenase nickel incorporation protein HypA/HybF